MKFQFDVFGENLKMNSGIDLLAKLPLQDLPEIEYISRTRNTCVTRLYFGLPTFRSVSSNMELFGK